MHLRNDFIHLVIVSFPYPPGFPQVFRQAGHFQGDGNMVGEDGEELEALQIEAVPIEHHRAENPHRSIPGGKRNAHERGDFIFPLLVFEEVGKTFRAGQQQGLALPQGLLGYLLFLHHPHLLIPGGEHMGKLGLQNLAVGVMKKKGGPVRPQAG